MSAENLPTPEGMCDGGDLDCGSGLLLIIREAMQPIAGGAVLEVRSRESSVRIDLPAWCRLVGHNMLGDQPGEGGSTSYFIRKKGGEPDDAYAQDIQAAKDYRWTVRARSKEPMRARAYVRNHSFDVGQPASFDTEDAAPSAIEYLLAALAGDLSVGMRWRASRENIEVYELEVSLTTTLDNVLVFLGLEDQGHPGMAGVEGRLFIDADADEATLERLWQETLLRSPVAQTLAREIPITIEHRKH